MKRISIFLLVSLLGAGMALAEQEYSADSIMKMKGRPENKAKIHFGKEKMRIEAQGIKQAGATIVRRDKNLVWILMPASKTYMEQKFNPAQGQYSGMTAEKKIPGEVERKKLGRERVNGIDCDKYLITVKVGTKTQSSYFWIGDGIPVKSAAVDGSWSSELKNIKKGRQPDSLFELPAGYKKFSLPAMKGLPLKGMPLPR